MHPSILHLNIYTVCLCGIQESESEFRIHSFIGVYDRNTWISNIHHHFNSSFSISPSLSTQRNVPISHESRLTHTSTKKNSHTNATSERLCVCVFSKSDGNLLVRWVVNRRTGDRGFTYHHYELFFPQKREYGTFSIGLRDWVTPALQSYRLNTDQNDDDDDDE